MSEHVNAAANMLSAKKASRGTKGKKRGSPFPVRGVAIFLLIAFVIGLGVAGSVAAAPGIIARGVTVNDLDLGGRTAEEAKRLLKERVAAMEIAYVAKDARATLVPAGSRNEGRFAEFSVDAAVTNALAVGRGRGPLASLAERVKARFFGAAVALPYSIDDAALRLALETRLSTKTRPARDAKLVVRAGDGAPKVTFEKEQAGIDIDYATAVRETERRLMALASEPVTVPVREIQPTFTTQDIEPLAAGVVGALAKAPLALDARGETWTVSRDLLADWLAAVPSGDDPGSARLGIDPQKAGKFLSSRATSLASEPKDASYEEKDGKVVKFVPGIHGETLDVQASITAIEAVLFGDEKNAAPISMVIASVRPKIDTEDANPYGIKEIIGVGETNFRGSPTNRRHNIAVGAKAVGGTLIPPGEEFSMLKTLGKIDGTTGYRQELVIKGSETKPEYGGGLCQIGSTAFRAALDSGLEITERRNHSYRVPYYERDGDGSYIGPGKDATIYDPAPDFKFLNDTGRHVLIMTAIDGNRLTFTFWGVRDGRKAEQTAARVFDIVQPPEKKIIETADLKPGEEKCTEKPHVGSKAVFTYTVTRANGEVVKKDFYSHYRPWQEVCLVGIDPNAPKAPGTGTPEEGLPSVDASGAEGH